MADRIPSPTQPITSRPATARAVLLGERIDTTGLERRDALSTSPLSFRIGETGFAAVFRYGVVVLIGLGPIEEDEALRGLQGRVSGAIGPREEETARVEPEPDGEDRVDPEGVIRVAELTPDRLLVIADALAKSAALAHAERQVDAVLDEIEPWARELADAGRPPGGRRAMLRMIGGALRVQHRFSRRVAASERLDILWDRPDLNRLYSRLEDEYELVERGEALNRKLALVSETGARLTDLIDTERSLRLEMIIVVLIVAELVIALGQLAAGAFHHH
ncbi:MAG: RMD1 family protein [Caulobacteraceae bacterium]